MIIRSDFINEILNLINSSDGVISIFISNTHVHFAEDEKFLHKHSIGSAGTVFRKDLAKEVIENIPKGPSFDFKYCEYLKLRNIKLLCCKHSLIQYIGFTQGQYSSGRNGDIDINFFDYTPTNSYILNEIILN